MIILSKRPRSRYIIAGGYKLHAKMPMHVYSSYVRHGMFSGVLQSYNLGVTG